MTQPAYDMPPKIRSGWNKMISAVPPSGGYACRLIKPETVGVGEQALYLAAQSRLLAETYDIEAEARAMGWSVPPAVRIPVLLEGTRDFDWHLEPHEMDF